MQYLDGRLYIVTTDGTLACIDATEEAIHAAQQGTLPQALDIKAAASLPTVEPTVTLEVVESTDGGIVLECFQDGSRLRVRVASSGYDPTWRVQFPKEIREPGARYLVEGVRPSARGGFYRAYGDIRRLR